MNTMPVTRVCYLYSTQYQEVFMNTKNSRLYTKVYGSPYYLLKGVFFMKFLCEPI